MSAMPYIDPDEQDQRTYVRFPGDPFPQDERHNDFSRREKSFGEVGVTARHVGSDPTPADEFEALMAAPGEYIQPADEADGLDEYDELVQKTYAAVLADVPEKHATTWAIVHGLRTQQAAGAHLQITQQAVSYRIKQARKRLAEGLEWIIDPAVKAKYKEPQQVKVTPRTVQQIAVLQHVGTWLARSDYDDAARWQVGRGLQRAIEVGSDKSDLARRTQIMPRRLVALVSDYRKG